MCSIEYVKVLVRSLFSRLDDSFKFVTLDLVIQLMHISGAKFFGSQTRNSGVE